MNVRCSAVILAMVEGTSSFAQTTASPMMTGIDGWQATALHTIGETVTGWTPPGKPDGLGARRTGDTLEIWMNHELLPHETFAYTLQNGLALTGARITHFKVLAATRQLISAELAYDRIFDRFGNEVFSATQINEETSSINGIDRLCSASFYSAGEFNLVDDLYFAGEETPNGQAFVLDVENADLYCAPMLGRAKYENVAFLQPPGAGHVALLIGDDTPTAPLYLYIGEKDHFGTGGFLDRNGLAFGTLYVLALGDGQYSPQHFNGTGNRTGGIFLPIAHFNPGLAGTPGYDAQGFADQDTQYGLGDLQGMFRFSRPEDVATDPYDHTRAVYTSTGHGLSYPADDWGTSYIVDVDLSDLSVDLQIIYDGDDAGNGQFATPDHGLRSPDNAEWGVDGMIYIQEDEATTLHAFGGASGSEASIWSIDPRNYAIERIAMIDRSAIPGGQYDNAPGDLGNWEPSGILDITHLMDDPDHVVLLSTVMAHSLHGGTIGTLNLNEGGQLLFLDGPPNSGPTLSLHAVLQGPFDESVELMHDDLREQELLPEQQPFTAPPFIYDQNETVLPGVFGRTGSDAIVDWVLVELRDPLSPSVTIGRRAGLLQRDGDIVDLDGTSPLRFDGIASGEYRIALRHRNHFDVITAQPWLLGPLPIHLDLDQSVLFGVEPVKVQNGISLLWAGDVNKDGTIRYTGSGNDRDPILQALGGTVATNTITGYLPFDIDMDGVVRYTGSANDRDIILQNIGGVVPTAQLTQQMP